MSFDSTRFPSCVLACRVAHSSPSFPSSTLGSLPSLQCFHQYRSRSRGRRSGRGETQEGETRDARKTGSLGELLFLSRVSSRVSTRTRFTHRFPLFSFTLPELPILHQSRSSRRGTRQASIQGRDDEVSRLLSVRFLPGHHRLPTSTSWIQSLPTRRRNDHRRFVFLSFGVLRAGEEDRGLRRRSSLFFSPPTPTTHPSFHLVGFASNPFADSTSFSSSSARQATIERFTNSADVTVFLISLKAGGVALNLTEASRVFLMDSWWNPAVEYQAMDVSSFTYTHTSRTRSTLTPFAPLSLLALLSLPENPSTWSTSTCRLHQALYRGLD